MNLKTIPYSKYERGLPQEGNVIVGQRHGDSLLVYQAFNDAIADYALAHQKFGGPNYSFSRMTWIKPNFLWMMYRSGWAEKENQTRILAIEMAFTGFETLLEQGVITSHSPAEGSEQVWREKLNHSDVRIQWDPDHDCHGAKLRRRAVQTGIKGQATLKFNHEWIQSIQDLTPFVKEQKSRLDNRDLGFSVVEESVISVNEALKEKFGIPR